MRGHTQSTQSTQPTHICFCFVSDAFKAQTSIHETSHATQAAIAALTSPQPHRPLRGRQPPRGTPPSHCRQAPPPPPLGRPSSKLQAPHSASGREDAASRQHHDAAQHGCQRARDTCHQEEEPDKAHGTIAKNSPGRLHDDLADVVEGTHSHLPACLQHSHKLCRRLRAQVPGVVGKRVSRSPHAKLPMPCQSARP